MVYLKIENMKTKNFYLVVCILGLFTWSCNKTDSLKTPGTPQVSLKSALTTGVQDLSTAVTSITGSAGYQVVNGPTDLVTKSMVVSPWDTVTHSILLADIAGIYDYKAVKFRWMHFDSMRFFNKTKDTTVMVVRLPEEKVKGSRKLLSYSPADTLLVNNYKITVSDYKYSFSHSIGSSYQMASAINIKGVAAGTYKIQYSKNKVTGYHFSSEFDFPNGFITKTYYTPGDTAISVYAISNGKKTLYEEKYTAIKTAATGGKHREREFSLTIGDVMIVRELGHQQASLDSAKVYVAGVLQVKSKVEIVANSSTPSDDTDNCFTNHKRDLKITFDDGTTKTLSELAGSVITNIGDLFTSLRQANFGTAIIDMVAWDVYFKKP